MIASWYAARKMRPPDPDVLSETGWIADERVAGWIYMTNSSLCMIEGIISNPFTASSLRQYSLQTLCSFLVDTSYILGYKRIMAASRLTGIYNIATKLGFRCVGDDYKILILEDCEE